LVRLVERSCDRFEAAWREGKRPRIEDETLAVPEPGRSELLRELLVLELAYRRRAGEGPGPREYRERFRGYERVVDEAFGLPGPDARGPGPAGEAIPTPGSHDRLSGETTCADEPGLGDREDSSSRALARPGGHTVHADAADLTDRGPGREAAPPWAGAEK